jgi:GDP-D-mannose dehydratase
MSDFRYTPLTVGIIKRHSRTMAPETIATIMRCSVGTIELICRKHGIDMRERDAPEPATPAKVDERRYRRSKLDVSLDDTTLAAVNTEARRRGLTGRELVAVMIKNIVDSHIYSAVLDR